jgi:hypothetical protein
MCHRCIPGPGWGVLGSSYVWLAEYGHLWKMLTSVPCPTSAPGARPPHEPAYAYEVASGAIIVASFGDFVAGQRSIATVFGLVRRRMSPTHLGDALCLDSWQAGCYALAAPQVEVCKHVALQRPCSTAELHLPGSLQREQRQAWHGRWGSMRLTCSSDVHCRHKRCCLVAVSLDQVHQQATSVGGWRGVQASQCSPRPCLWWMRVCQAAVVSRVRTTFNYALNLCAPAIYLVRAGPCWCRCLDFCGLAQLNNRSSRSSLTRCKLSRFGRSTSKYYDYERPMFQWR